MPTYEYACRGCGRSLEVVQSFSDDPLTTCEDCGGELRKVFSAAGLIFKGSGWHIKDYAGSGRGGASSSSTSSTSSTASDGGTTSGGSGGSAASGASTGSGGSGASTGAGSGGTAAD